MDSNRKFWDRTARLYRPIQEKSNRALYDRVAGCCGRYIHEDSRVLELACGSGQLTLPLHKKAAFWEATDFSQPMLEQLHRRCPEVSCCVQDATALTYDRDSFDVVVVANALHIMPRPELACGEIMRVLRPGGVLLAPTFVYEGRVNRLRMRLTTLVGLRSFHKWDSAGLVAFLMAAGFSVTEQTLLPGDPLPECFVAAETPRQGRE